MTIRIGKFAKRHKVSQFTIRHYLDMGLLVTEKEGGQYRFTDEDSRDLEKIMLLKDLGFSLSEIQQTLTYQRFTGNKSKNYKNMYLSMLEEKRDLVKKAQKKYEEIDSYLEKTIKELKDHNTSDARRLGFPIKSVGLLHCPRCRLALNISDGIIGENTLIKGTIKCSCGYSAVFEDGIYIDKKSVRKKLLNGKPMPPGMKYFKETSPDFINFRYKGMGLIIEKLREYGNPPNYIMELSFCVGFFLTQYLKDLAKDSTFILIDYDLDRLTNLKERLEMEHDHENFIFLCCDIDGIPLANSSIDIIIDYWMTKDYGQSDKKFLLDTTHKFLKEGGLLVGAYPYITPGSKGYNNMPLDIRNYFNIDMILSRFEDLKFMELDTVRTRPIIENNQYNFDIRDKEVSQLIYVGRKS